MKLRRAWLTLAALLAIAGCPQSGPDNTPAGTSLTASTRGPAAAEVGDDIALAVDVGGDVDMSRVTYTWYQTYGRVVDVDDAAGATLTFTAPSLEQAQTLRFRVDVSAPGLATVSREIEVLIARDDTGGGDGSDGDGEVDQTPRVELVTSMGTIVVELDRMAAPISTRNFLRYVDEGFYDGTIFHRVIEDFVVQGGGFEPELERKDPRAPIRNESSNGLTNDRGTIAMARTSDPDSATSQFYFNLVDNDSLNRATNPPGYAVFGRVVTGLDVIDDIALVATESRDGFQDVPVEDVLLERATRVQEGTTEG